MKANSATTISTTAAMRTRRSWFGCFEAGAFAGIDACSTAIASAVLAGIALGMSMLPEEFPVVLTVFMAMGAWRISQARVLTRRAAAIETTTVAARIAS